jgi:uncharacterized protein YoxC
MPIADAMRKLGNDVKSSRSSRKSYVRGNKEMAKNLMDQNRQFLHSLGEQNKAIAEQTHEFLRSAKEEHLATYKQTMDTIRADVTRIRQSKDAIAQGSRALMKEYREDREQAHKYWATLSDDKPIADPTAKTAKGVSEKKEQRETHGRQSETSKHEQESQKQPPSVSDEKENKVADSTTRDETQPDKNHNRKEE